MNIYEYQAQALQTAIYPLERALDYTVLGLVSEVGELAPLVAQIDMFGDFTAYATAADFKSELGDGHWYTVAIADALGTTLGEIIGRHKEHAEECETLAQQRTFAQVYLGLVSSSAQIAGITKKSIRDDNSTLSDEKREQLEHVLVSVSTLLYVLGDKRDMSLKQVWNANLNKLADRKNRDQIKGSGDHR